MPLRLTHIGPVADFIRLQMQLDRPTGMCSTLSDQIKLNGALYPLQISFNISFSQSQKLINIGFWLEFGYAQRIIKVRNDYF